VLGFRRKGDGSPSIVQLVRGLIAEAIRLVRVEVDLVKARFSRTARRAGIGLGVAAAGATLAFLGAVGVIVATGLALGLVLPAWAAALVVAGALLGAGGATARLGVAQFRTAMESRASGPPEIETELPETRYRLEAELEALTAKLDPRHHALAESARTNGHAQTLTRMPR
jgi:putative superfamily III holin-X